MPMPAHLSLEGQNQGKIEGSCDIKGREGTILVQAVDHSINIPKNPQTGLPSGKRIHGPMTVTKVIDKASPKVFQALCAGEQMKSVKMDYYRISPKGSEEKYYTVELKNAIIVGVRSWMPNALQSENQQMGHMEDVSFTYETIVWTWHPDGIEAEDSWAAPK